MAASAEPVDRSPLGRFAIDGILSDGASTYMQTFFHILAGSGDGRRVFIARGVCKRWRQYVDAMSNAEYGRIYATLCSDPVLASYLERLNVVPDAFASVCQRWPDLRFADLVKQELVRGGRTASHVVDVLVWVLLDHLAMLAVEAACSGRRFAEVYDLSLRGYSYYAVFKASKHERKVEGVDGQLQEWWEQTLKRTTAEVQQRLVGANVGEAAKRAAKASVRDFVDKMTSIAFHGCRWSKDASFREHGTKVVDDWAWP